MMSISTGADSLKNWLGLGGVCSDVSASFTLLGEQGDLLKSVNGGGGVWSGMGWVPLLHGHELRNSI